MRDTGLALGRQLRAARVLAGLEQAELAKAAHLHVNSTFQMAEVAVPRDLFWDILRRIDQLRRPVPAIPALLRLKNGSWFPDTACSAIIGADNGSHLKKGGANWWRLMRM